MTATGRGDVGDGIDDVAVGVTPLTQFVASAEPGVVFASLAAQCVPDLCDDCAIDVVDGGEARYSIVFPPRATSTGSVLRMADRLAGSPDAQVRVPFSHPRSAPGTFDDELPEDADRGAFHGVAVFGWHRRIPTRSDRTAAAALVDRAVQTVLRQRSEQAAEVAVALAANLQLALHNSRRLGAAIGILMALHKITEEQAFELLARASQRSHRKVSSIAGDVLHTGWLDPALVRRRVPELT